METLNEFSEDFIQEKLINLINTGKISTESLSIITKIDEKWLDDYVTKKQNTCSISENKKNFLSYVVIMLSDGANIDYEERLKGIMDILMYEYKFNLETLALCSGVNVNTLKRYIDDVNSVPFNEKYKMSIKIIFVYYIFKSPDYNDY